MPMPPRDTDEEVERTAGPRREPDANRLPRSATVITADGAAHGDPRRPMRSQHAPSRRLIRERRAIAPRLPPNARPAPGRKTPRRASGVGDPRTDDEQREDDEPPARRASRTLTVKHIGLYKGMRSETYRRPEGERMAQSKIPRDDARFKTGLP